MGKRVKGERERDRDRDRQTDRQRHRERDTERETQREREREREREGGITEYLVSVKKVKINTSLGTLECRFPDVDR